MSKMEFIDYQHIFLKFNEQILFEDFNLRVEKNDKILLAAGSGRGKTTLVKMLLGFTIPDSGVIYVDGIKLTAKTIADIRGRITYISQDTNLPKGLVAEVFKEIFNFQKNRSLKVDLDDLRAWLGEFSLPSETIDKEVDDLSGGERQRLAIIFGILLKRDIWILDEVTTGLDPDLKKKVIDLLLAKEGTMLIISHDELFKDQGLREVAW